MTLERDYVLGTHDDEIARLGVQHRVWRPKMLGAWRRAGFGAGMTIADIGCGPGYAALDLAEIVGPSGRVIAVERSRRFLDTLESEARPPGVANIDTHERDLDADGLPVVTVDGTWCRWVAAFLTHPRDLIVGIHRIVRPGGAVVFHEYLDYAAWRLLPRSIDVVLVTSSSVYIEPAWMMASPAGTPAMVKVPSAAPTPGYEV